MKTTLVEMLRSPHQEGKEAKEESITKQQDIYNNFYFYFFGVGEGGYVHTPRRTVGEDEICDRRGAIP